MFLPYAPIVLGSQMVIAAADGRSRNSSLLFFFFLVFSAVCAENLVRIDPGAESRNVTRQ